MDPNTAINLVGFIVLPIVSIIFGIILRMILAIAKANAELKDELAKYKLHVAEQYLNKDDFNRSISELKDSVQAIFLKIDKLVDQRNGQQ